MSYLIGIDPTETSADPEHKLGAVGWNTTDDGAKAYVYGQADTNGVTGEGYVVVLNEDYQADMVDTTASAPGTGQGKIMGVAQVAFSGDEYGWFQISGVTNVRVSANCAAWTEINTTSTAGELDDDATAGAEVADGIVLSTAAGGSAEAAAGFLNYPKVGRTL